VISGDYWGTRNLQKSAEFDAAKKKKCKHQQIGLFVSLLIHISLQVFSLVCKSTIIIAYSQELPIFCLFMVY